MFNSIDDIIDEFGFLTTCLMLKVINDSLNENDIKNGDVALCKN